MMKTIVLLLVAIVLIEPLYTYAQAPDTLWTKSYGVQGRIAECWDAVGSPDGGILTAGTITDPGYLSRIYVIKIDSDGDTLWTATYAERTAGRAICATPDNGYVVTGYYVTSEVYPIIIKTDSSGNELWSYIYEDWGAAALRSCQPVGSDGYILSGFTYTSDALLVRINDSGDTLWSRIYGGSEAEKFWSARPTSNGGFIVAGWTESYGNGGSDFYIIKTDQNGDPLWERTYGYQDRNEEAREIMETPDGGFVFSGRRAATYDSYIYYFMKISSQGDSLWTFADSSETWPSILHSFTPAASGGYTAIGYKWNTIDVFRISNVGGLYWSTSFIDNSVVVGYGRSIIQSEDHGFFLCGNNGSDVWVKSPTCPNISPSTRTTPTPSMPIPLFRSRFRSRGTFHLRYTICWAAKYRFWPMVISMPVFMM
jgi:hypothetical protein